MQKVVFVRGSALAHEPSFYALYAIPYVVFINSRTLISRALNDKLSQKGECFIRFCDNKKQFALTFFVNLFLLVSTATTAFFSYIVFFFVLMFFRRYPFVEDCFFGLRKKLLKVSAIFVTLFVLVGVMIPELFKRTFLKFFYYGLSHESFNDRFTGIINAVKVFCDYPLFGVGLGGVGPLVYSQEMNLRHQAMLTELDRYEIHTLEPTNVFTEVLGCLGIYGFLGFALFIILLWRQFRIILNDNRILIEEKVNVLAFLISIIVMIICLQINQGLFRGYIWVHIGIGIGYIYKIKVKTYDDG